MKKLDTLCLCILAIFNHCVYLHAEDGKVPAKSPWESSAGSGLTLTRGNSKTLLATVNVDSKKKWTLNELALGLSGGYGKSSGVRNTDFVKGSAQYNRLLRTRTYFGAREDVDHDGIADLAYRSRASILMGYYLVKNEKTSLSMDAGPSAVNEKYEGNGSNGYVGARFGEKLEHKITASSKAWQSLDYAPAVSDWMDKYLINGELGISTAITTRWDLRSNLQVTHDSEPRAGRDYTDLRLMTGTSYSF